MIRRSPPWAAEIRWLFLDMGGVLMDERETDAQLFPCLRQALGEFGIDATLEQVESAWRQTLFQGSWASLTLETTRKLCPDQALVPTIRDQALKLITVRDCPWDDALKAVPVLAERYSLGVIANQLPGSRQRLEEAGLARWFTVLALSDEIAMEKPNPSIFEYALKTAGCPPEEAAMVGDQLTKDIAGAHRLGMRAVWIRRPEDWTARDPTSGEETPDLTVQSLTELVESLA